MTSQSSTQGQNAGLKNRLVAWASLLLFFPAVVAMNHAFVWLFPAHANVKASALSSIEQYAASPDHLMMGAYVYENRAPGDVLATFYETLGTQLATRGQMLSAADMLGKATHMAPKDPVLFLNYGLVLEALEKDKDAIAAYQKAVDLMPELVIARYNMGLLQDKLGDTDTGIADLRKALTYDPDSPFLNYDLGVMYAKKNDYANSALYSGNAVKTKADFAEAYNNYAYALAHLGKYDQSLAMADKSLSLKPDSAATIDTRGFALQGMKKYDDALGEYKKAVKLDPTIGEIYQHMAQCYEAMGDYTKASTAYQTYLDLTPDATDKNDTEHKILKLKHMGKDKPQQETGAHEQHAQNETHSS